MLPAEERKDLVAFTRRVLIVLLIVALALALWQIAYLLILVFGGVLLAVVLHHLAAKVAALTGLGQRWALGLVAVSLLALLVAAGWLFGQQAGSLMQQLGTTLRQGLSEGGRLLEGVGIRELLPSEGSAAGLLGSVLRPVNSVLHALAAVLVVLFLGLYLAASPTPYRDGLIRLLPRARHERARQVVDAVGKALWRWMIGQAVSMLVIFLLTTTALLLLGVPLAVPLGIIAGLLEFIPIVGPWLAAVPAVLIALTQGGQTALWVALAYFLIQQVESYVIHPVAERWAVSLPPALTVAATVAMGLLFGFIGVLFATPIAVAVMVVVRMVYIRDTLGEKLDASRMPG